MMKNNIYIIVKSILLFCLIAGYPFVPLYCQNMIIDGTTYSTGQQLYFSPGTITSPDSCSKPVQVTGNANISYKAVQYIHLGGGFSTALSSGCGTFHAYTGNRPQACPVAIITGDNVSCGPSVLSAATSTNDSGTITAYQWQLNGEKILGATSVTYTAALSGDYTVLVSNSYNCTVISTVYPIIVNPVLPVSVSTAASANPVCTGSPVTFTATPVNGGSAVYQWYVNAIPVGTGPNTYTYIPVNGDLVYVIMTSSEPCVSGNPATSNTVSMTVNPNLVPVSVVPSDGNVSALTRAPGNTWKYQRTEYLVTAAEMAASGFPSGHEINSIGFSIATAGGTTQTGTLNIWLKNTSDATYTLGTTWTTSGFTQVSGNTSWTVPIAAGGYNVPFTGGSSFTYNGGGVYVAWEFSNSGTAGTTAVVHNCNISLANGIMSNRSNSVLPSTLVASSIRPATTFTSLTLIDITTVTNIYTYERVPVPFGICPPPEVRVCNVSCSPQSFDVTLTVKDATTGTIRYTATQAVTGLAAGAATIVSFSCWNMTILENVNITATTSVIGGENLVANNTKTIPANVNNNLFSYNYYTTGSSPFGFTYPGTGIFASKFTMNGPGKIPGANIVIANYAANTGKTVYAVVLDNTGAIVAQSANHVIAAGELGTNVNFTFPTPPVFINEIFYVGLAQTSGTAQYYPMGTFPESPVRTNTFYIVNIAGGTPELLTGFDLKYGIEAQVGTATLPAHDVGTVSVNVARVITLGSTTPTATVRNYGANTETFNVTMTLGAYTSTRSVQSLASGAYAQVTFDPWTISLGDYTVNVCTQLAGDMNVANDCKTNAVKVLDMNKVVYGYNAYAGTGTDPEGPMTFTLSNPGNLISIADQSALQFISGGTWANGTWYGTVYNTVPPYNFITIDPVTGAHTIIGNMGIVMNGLSYNPANSIMYAVGYDGANSKLYTINMSTGAATLVGSAGGVLLTNLAINNAGHAYAVDLNADVLGTIDLSTGAFTVIGSIGFDAEYAQDMEFDRDANVLYMAAEDVNSGWLAYVDITTGNTLKIGDFEGGAEVTGFAIPYAATKTLNVKVVLEGLYDGGGIMRQAYDDLGPHFGAGIADKVYVELHNAANYSIIEYTSGLVELSVAGIITINTIPASLSGSYYITIKHRNSIETTSAAPVSFAASTVSYDFSTAASKAYGDNMRDINGVYVIYGGEVYQEGLIDLSDMVLVEADINLFATGYLVTDVNGDGIVDLSDMVLVEQNINLFISSILP